MLSFSGTSQNIILSCLNLTANHMSILTTVRNNTVGYSVLTCKYLYVVVL